MTPDEVSAWLMTDEGREWMDGRCLMNEGAGVFGSIKRDVEEACRWPGPPHMFFSDLHFSERWESRSPERW